MTRGIILALLILFHFNLLAQKEEVSIISWNIRDFGKTKNSEELNQIAELVRDVDILAIQEVVAGYGGAQAVAKLTDILNRKGSKWDYVISDPTKGPKYTTERYAFIWKTHKIKIKNRGRLISELESLVDREPFLLDFYLGGKQFSMVNFHSRPYNKDPESEIEALTNYIIKSLKAPLIIAGDFNVDEKMPIFNSLKKAGYQATITGQKTTLKKSCNGIEYLNYPIDNVFHSKDIKKIEGKAVDFVRSCELLEQARELSDHLPVYLRFSLE